MNSDNVLIPADLAIDVLLNLKHNEDCPERVFTVHNSHLPPQHPAWEFRPACNCHVSKFAAAMKSGINNFICTDLLK